MSKSRRLILHDPAWVCELDMDMDECRDLRDQSTSDSNLHNEAMDIELCCQFDDPGLHTTRSCTPYVPGTVTPGEVSSPHYPESSYERPPSCSNLRSLYKRKLGFPGAEVVELEQRKRQRVCNMEDSAS
ncbi:uncharacterized protein LOC117806163 isoform X2 [Xyrichtys novacula]|uniref:Uncharacterized protein LOC117806163 isoform X2 n=1 Tax=Xyrichtys novacula TaxID=13765 RepID=A0AAV1GJ01_XYRNO|nr:uncharacterized protein LOC117806163 isoform X2 [Xyrichtys novacula]